MLHLSLMTLCDPLGCSPPGFSAHRIFQARILEWVAVSFSRRSSQPRDQTRISYNSCIGKQILYHWAGWEVPIIYLFQIAGFPNSFLYNKQKPQMMHCIQLQVSLVSFKLEVSSLFSSWPWHYWRVQIVYFVECLSVWICLCIFKSVKYSLWRSWKIPVALETHSLKMYWLTWAQICGTVKGFNLWIYTYGSWTMCVHSSEFYTLCS